MNRSAGAKGEKRKQVDLEAAEEELAWMVLE
jgi:hypothetical protein